MISSPTEKCRALRHRPRGTDSAPIPFTQNADTFGPEYSQVRAIDATTVKEPGRTGSLWRVHYSVRLPAVACEFFKPMATKGGGTGESFVHFPIRSGDYLLADRGYSTFRGILHVADAGGRATVRMSTSALPLHKLQDRPFDLVAAV